MLPAPGGASQQAYDQPPPGQVSVATRPSRDTTADAWVCRDQRNDVALAARALSWTVVVAPASENVRVEDRMPRAAVVSTTTD